MTKVERIQELIIQLNEAREAYYAKDLEIMSNFQYDTLADELEALEKEMGIVYSNSPSVQVGYEAIDSLPKEVHDRPMLSLAKTKEREALQAFLESQEGILSWKLDGLTIVLSYEDGILQKAVTRGNGEVGEVITNNAKVFTNVPLTIAYKGRLVIRGEAVISYSDFESINESMEEDSLKYKNPRNLCSGSVRQLNNKITQERSVQFFAFALVLSEDSFQTREDELQFIKELGFGIVEYKLVSESTILDAVNYFAEEIESFDLPSDGLVLNYNNIAYGSSLGATSKFPRDSIAFKWADEIKETKLLEIEWSASRTGLINPVAIFEPVELEGTTVSRASVHNISVLKALKLGLGDVITVYKANMIIPQIAENLTESDTMVIPSLCPVCSEATKIHQSNEGQFLYCTNEECSAKKIKAFTLFVGRDALNIDGLSEASLEKFVALGFLHQFSDLYDLKQHKEALISLEGFGLKSFENLMNSIENSKITTLAKVIYGLGITGVGLATAKVLCKHFSYDIQAIEEASVESLMEVEGVGEVIAKAISDYFGKEANKSALEALLSKLQIEKPEENVGDASLENQVIVITGDVNIYANRNALKEAIEARGGKVTGSVSAKTSILVNNDVHSNSSKNKKAKDLGVPILSEEEFHTTYLL